MKSVFWGNYKGGVGKTTSTFQVAAHFASCNKKVLLIDLDPQCSLSHICCVGSNKKLEDFHADKTLNFILELYIRDINSNDRLPFQLLTGKSGSDLKEYIKPTLIQIPDPNFMSSLYFIPSSLYFSNSRMNELAQYMSENIFNVFLIKLFLDAIRSIGDEGDNYRFDYVFFDCPPTTNMLTQSVFLASDYYIIPTICDEVSINGVPDYIKEIEKTHNKFGSNDRIRGVLIEKVFPKKSQFVGVFETLYKNRSGTQNHGIIESLDKNISKVILDSIVSQDCYKTLRYNKPEDPITTNHIFCEAIDHRDARRSGESVSENTANAKITEEYRDLALKIMEVL